MTAMHPLNRDYIINVRLVDVNGCQHQATPPVFLSVAHSTWISQNLSVYCSLQGVVRC